MPSNLPPGYRGESAAKADWERAVEALEHAIRDALSAGVTVDEILEIVKEETR